jgi:hypothetical protein
MSTKTTTPKNPLASALRELEEKHNVKHATARLSDATDGMVKEPRICLLKREIRGAEKRVVPSEATMLHLHSGLRRLGLKRGLPPADWMEFSAAVRALAAPMDRRRKEVRARLESPRADRA